MLDGGRGSLVVVLAGALCVPLAATSLGAATAEIPLESRSEPLHGHAFSVDWPAGWSVVATDSAGVPPPGERGGGAIPVLARAIAADDAEACEVIDLSALKAALAPFGIDDAQTLLIAAVGARHGSTRAASYSADGESSSSWYEGVHDGMPFRLYSLLGHGSWTGLEDAWLGLDCWATTDDHADWREIAKTFTFRPSADILASTGPFVVGGRIEVPAAGVALELPTDWQGAVISSDELIPTMESLGPPVAHMADQLGESFRDYFDAVERGGSQFLVWAWEPDGAYSWAHDCELIVREPRAATARALVEAGNRDAANRSGDLVESSWALVELPAGEAARHDYTWDSGRTGTEFLVVRDGATYELDCGTWQDEQPIDGEAGRDRYQEIAESLEIPRTPQEDVIA